MLRPTRLLDRLVPFRWVLEPALGLVLLGVWLLSGLAVDIEAALALVFYCASVALSRVLPAVSLCLIWAAVVVDVGNSGTQEALFRVIAALAVFLTTFGVAAHAGPVARWFDFASAFLLGPAVAYLFTVGGELKFPQFGPVIAGYYTSQGVGLLLMSLLLIVAFVAGWFVGYLVARQRATPTTDGRSVLVWLASSGGTRLADPHTESAGLVRRLTRPELTFDIAGAAAFAFFCIVLDAVNVGGFDGSGGPRSGFLVMIGFAVAVAVRRMSPAVALSLAWISAILQMTTGHNIQFSDVGVLIVLYATAAYGDTIVRWSGLISAGIGAVVASLYLTLTSAVSQNYLDLLSSSIGQLTLQFAFLFVVSVTVLGLSWVLGLLMRTWRNARVSRRAQVAAEFDRARAVEDVVVEQERTRIARDMHDVVAHSLAVVIAQADGARYARHSDPDTVDEALKTIASTARSALGDVRVLLAELRHAQPEGPQPSLDDLERTVDQIRAAGLDVTVERVGDLGWLGSAQQIAAYRIVQEALTNALRHGDTAASASVVLAEVASENGGPGVVITVRNTMKPISIDTPSAGTASARVGHGLPGMRERATLAGGSLAAGPAGDLFVVSAFLPAGAAA
ncbi:sensor histidine kinase [Leifsonia poae]|uniref:sensor histidine kinase n=1 Tax=Leifsonia poae TaxID=110933 RepID=UPI001CBBCBC3|nr:histidine kinase [Leifsonia poae]